MVNNNFIRAALIGLGGIAWKYDAKMPGRTWPLSQAGAMIRHNLVTIVGGCSPDKDDREAFSAWLGGVSTFAEPLEMLRQLKPDLIGICSPTDCHYAHARLCMENGVRVIWLEKPPTLTLTELHELIKLSGHTGTVVCVDYIRRYMPGCRRMREMICENIYGKCSQFLIRYSPGLVRNGSHLLDMCFFLSGSSGSQVLWAGGDDSTSPAFAVRLDTGQMVIAGEGSMPYHTNDFSAVCEGGIISMSLGGKVFKAEKRIENSVHPGFYELGGAESFGLKYGEDAAHMTNALDDLLEASRTNRLPVSNLKSSLLSQELLEMIVQRSKI